MGRSEHSPYKVKKWAENQKQQVCSDLIGSLLGEGWTDFESMLKEFKYE